MKLAIMIAPGWILLLSIGYFIKTKIKGEIIDE
jgi:hypothetical protein